LDGEIAAAGGGSSGGAPADAWGIDAGAGGGGSAIVRGV
jgi:hypothetical protein